MDIPVTSSLRPSLGVRASVVDEHRAASISAVSWGAVFAGAAAAAALSLVLMLLGTGLGLAFVSPWSGQGMDGTAFGAATIGWLAFTQLAAAGIGGYLAGRLRTRWSDAAADEVYFRDTAHGFLAWSVATILTAALLASAVGSAVSGGAKLGAAVVGTAATAGGAAAAALSEDGNSAGQGANAKGSPVSMAYWVDSLFRDADVAAPASEPSGTGVPTASNASNDHGATDAASSTEATRIFAHALTGKELASADAHRVAQLVARRTGLSVDDAGKRVNAVFARVRTASDEARTAARDAADQARKASSYAALWVVLSLFIGAFVASLCATFGGRLRDA